VPLPGLPSTLIADGRSFAEWCERHLDSTGPLPLPRPELETLYRAAGGGNVTYLSGNTMKALPRSPAPRWRSLGEHLQAIARGCSGHGDFDNRLQRAPTGMGVADPSTGGFAVAENFVVDLLGFMYERAIIAPLCDRRTISAPFADIKIPAIDETSRADGSRWGGAVSYWLQEGSQVPSTFPRFRNLSFEGKKLIAIIVVSNELLADAAMLEAHIRRVFAAEFAFQIDRAILTGTGLGQPDGVLGAPGTIVINKLPFNSEVQRADFWR
jgi:hypothetical protein